jgi:hypothetical protein
MSSFPPQACTESAEDPNYLQDDELLQLNPGIRDNQWYLKSVQRDSCLRQIIPKYPGQIITKTTAVPVANLQLRTDSQ